MAPPRESPLLAMMVVRNEANRYLRPVLERLGRLVDGIVILDDASTDETPGLCRAHPKVIRFRQLNSSLFSRNEAALRSLLWEMTVELEPAWILALDADELLEEKAKTALPALTAQEEYELITFPVYHFWGDLRHYRVDRLWHPVLARTACLFRYRKNRSYHWAPRRLHCGRLPVEAYHAPRFHAPLRLLHLGYASPQARSEKYHRYLSLDPRGRFCPLTHYQSIMARQPRLRRWTGEDLEVLF